MADAEFAGVLVSRSEIARLAGVRRPAVSNWERRHSDFPAPVHVGAEPERFRADEILAWLARRNVPANARHADEAAGTTYGDRFRAGLSGGPTGGFLRADERAAGPEADRLRGHMPLDRYLRWLLYLVLNRIVEPGDQGLGNVVETFRRMVRDYGPSDRTVPRRLLDDLDRTLKNTPHGSFEEGRAAFDHVLVRWRTEHAREGGAFFTPPSVSRIMAQALAAVRPGAARVHDPYARTGELLVAYVDAAAALRGTVPSVTGRVPDPVEREVATMNVRVHHNVEAHLEEGPFSPALDPADSPGAFDILLTNPPFGRRVEIDGQPSYWTYGPARRSEFDWVQYIVSRLAPEGRAAVLLPAGAAFNTGAAAAVRTGLVEAGAVDCVISLPAGLFSLTAVPTQIWFLRPPEPSKPREPEVLLVAGGNLGERLTRTQWTLSDDDITRLVGQYVAWHEARVAGRTFAETPGLSRVVRLSDLQDEGHSLEPSRYVRSADSFPATGMPGPAEARERLAELAERIEGLGMTAAKADAEVERRLRRYGL